MDFCLFLSYCVNRSTAKAAVQCQGHGRAEVVQAQRSAPGQKIRLISCGTMSHVSDIKLIRTDTTLDLSQKAEKGMPGVTGQLDTVLCGNGDFFGQVWDPLPYDHACRIEPKQMLVSD